MKHRREDASVWQVTVLWVFMCGWFAEAPDSSPVPRMHDATNVSGTVMSQASSLPLAHSINVAT